MNARPMRFAPCLAILALAGCHDLTQPAPNGAPGLAKSNAAEESGGNVLTIDHQVAHVSTVPANQGEQVHLFVRERVRSDLDDGKPREAVLMIHGRSIPVLAVAELRHEDYDWAHWLARSGGFDVFMLDFQGSGRSPRPRMDDPCNVPTIAQQTLLIPNPLSATCLPSYGFTLNTAASDLDELDATVEYIRTLRGVDKVHLIAWSAGSPRMGAYAARHGNKVASLLFLAPIFNKGVAPVPPTNPPSPLPRPGTPMTLRTRAAIFAGDGAGTGWDPEVRCEGQREPGIQDVIWNAIMENDELGRTWGAPPAGAPAGSGPEGLVRVREVVQWGWNAEVAAKVEVPTLLIRGEFDTGQGGRQDVAELYGLIRNDNKLRFTVECAGHFIPWEKQRTALHQISKEWLKHGRVGGFANGAYVVDIDGNLRPMQP